MKGRKYLNNVFCGNHPDERLNLVCIRKKCLNRGLICQLCRGEQMEGHLNHLDAVLPVKYFLESLQANFDDKQTEFSAVVEQSCLSRLQKLRDEMLSRLAITVQELARLVKALEIRILKDYEVAKEEIRQKGLVFRQYKTCIDRCIIHNIRKEEKFELIAQIKKLVQHVKHVDPQGRKNPNKYHLDLTGKHVIAGFIEQNENLKIDCERLELDFKSIFGNTKQRENSKTLQKYQAEMLKRELRIIEHQNKSLLEAKRKAEASKISNIQDQKIEKKKEEKEKKKEKKKDEQEKKKEQPEKKGKKEKQAKIKEETKKSDQLLEKIDLTVPSALKTVISSFNSEEEQMLGAVIKKKKPKISFADFAQSEMKIQELTLKDKYGLKSTIFSSLFKGINIKITKSGRVAKQTATDEKAAGFVVVAQTLDKCKKVAFRINKIKEEVFLGLARHQTIAAHKYIFNMNGEGHGGYMINSKGIMYSSTIPQENKQQKPFDFEQGDIVNCIHTQGELFFERVPNKKSMSEAKEVSMSVAVNEGDAKNYNFCVFLGGNGDSVELI